jgi:hypothetical protein
MPGPGPEIRVEMFLIIQTETTEYVQHWYMREFNLQNVIASKACGTSVAEGLQLSSKGRAIA